MLTSMVPRKIADVQSEVRAPARSVQRFDADRAFDMDTPQNLAVAV
jgi:hypothetical protein